jgi:hypothetical protein
MPLLPRRGHFFQAWSQKKLSTLKIIFVHFVEKNIVSYFPYLQMIE